jgi:hypothetical protein
MYSARKLGSLGASLIMVGCVVSPPQGPSILTFPGTDKSAVAFQQDQSICQRHAISHSDYGLPSEPATQTPDGSAAANTAAGAAPAGADAESNKASAPAVAEMPDELGYAQCMAARGNTVQLSPVFLYNEQYADAYPDGFGYGSGGYPFVGGFGVFGFGSGHHHGFHNDGHHGGGYHGGWGGHGGPGHGGGGHGGGGPH